MSLLLLFSGGAAGNALAGALTVSVTAAGSLGTPQPLAGAVAFSVTLSGGIGTPQPLAGGLTTSVTAAATRLTMAQPLTGTTGVTMTLAGTIVAPAHPLDGALTFSVTAAATTLRVQLPAAYTATGWNTTNGSTTITGGTASASDIGALVTGPGIPAGTRIVSVTP